MRLSRGRELHPPVVGIDRLHKALPASMFLLSRIDQTA